MCGDRNQPIVTCGLAIFRLLGLDHADEPRVDQTARKCGLIHQQQNVDWIAIGSFRRWNEAKVVRKAAADGQNATECEDVLLFVVLELIAMTFWRLDHNRDFAIRIAGGQTGNSRVLHISIEDCLCPRVGLNPSWGSLLPRFGLSEPSTPQLLSRNAGEVWLDVENRRSVEHVDPAHVQLKTISPPQLDHSQRNRIRTPR